MVVIRQGYSTVVQSGLAYPFCSPLMLQTSNSGSSITGTLCLRQPQPHSGVDVLLSLRDSNVPPLQDWTHIFETGIRRNLILVILKSRWLIRSTVLMLIPKVIVLSFLIECYECNTVFANVCTQKECPGSA